MSAGTEAALGRGEWAGLSSEALYHALRTMYTIRYFEEKAEELYALGKVHGTMHLYIGEEAVAVGACLALRPDDYILSTHRGHGHCLAKGADVKRMMAEFMGKAAGYCRGRGGSMHIADVGTGNLGANGVVGGGLPIAPGVGLGIRLQRSDRICLCFFGDGAANGGAFHESLNLAAIWKLPVVYLCENNQYALSLPFRKGFAIERISLRAASYGMPGITVDGNDLFAVYEAVRDAAVRARRGEGPSLIEAVTYRWRGHSKSDRQRYRTREEVREWMARDPIARLRARMVEAGLFSDEVLEQLSAECRQAIEDAVAFAEAADEPDPSTIMDDVYA
ncbi:MAG: thiamine pyrophosphate-dependent dehydrogenase E1 component subunit alpha [Anaerolineae bacterium]|nr:thiamine pyrophosphate-dependent dehydrogenase E1 component subunit alpha [Anaerolineae bacterium]